MGETEKLRAVPPLLTGWYGKNRRDLPWRRDREPYHVWVSEIMLQQTRVEAVREKYTAFLRALPSVHDLASCTEDALFKLWEGLGYYSRARNLKKAAEVIVGRYGGVFPGTYGEIRALPGIGDYTAGAICSICFGMPTPAVDGNVLRVMARLLALEAVPSEKSERARLTGLLREIYPADDPGEFTQALMELGATVCLPNGTPKCAACPLEGICPSRDGSWRRYPLRPEKKARRQEERTVFLLTCGGRFALEKRPDTGLLAGMWQFPNVSGALEEGEAAALAETWGVRPLGLRCRLRRIHIFTHIRWDMTAYCMECGEASEGFFWADRAQMEREISLPSAFRQFLEDPMIESEEF